MDGGCLRAPLPTSYVYEERYGSAQAMVTLAESRRAPAGQKPQAEPRRERRTDHDRQHIEDRQVQQLVHLAAKSHDHKGEPPRRSTGERRGPRAAAGPPAPPRAAAPPPWPAHPRRRPPPTTCTDP